MYKILCKGGRPYTEETKRILSTRIKKHHKLVGKGDIEKSHLVINDDEKISGRHIRLAHESRQELVSKPPFSRLPRKRQKH